MYIKASYTVENAVIIPLFSLIVVLLLSVTCNIHDRIIYRNITNQFYIQCETDELNDIEKEQLRKKANDYLKERTIFSNYSEIETGSLRIKECNHKKYIREFNAVMEVNNVGN